jgi:hypothetical protein
MGILRHALGSLVLGVGVATAVVTAAPDVHAQQPNAVDRETARSRMEQGEAARERGELRAALRAFEEADAIMRVPSTGLEVARTQIALGMLLEAKETLGRVKAIPIRPGEPAPFTMARRQADQLAADVANRTPTLAVVVKNAEPGATPRVAIDGENVPAASAESPRKINPGAHAIVVSASNTERREEVKLAESEKRTVTVDLGLPAGPLGGGAGEPRDGNDAGATARGETPSSGSKALVYGGFGVAIVGASVGAVTGILSFGEVDDIKTKCGGTTCPPQYKADVDSAKSLGTIATIAFVAAGIGAVAGVVGLVLPASEEKPTASRARGITARPTIGRGFVGLDGRF